MERVRKRIMKTLSSSHYKTHENLSMQGFEIPLEDGKKGGKEKKGVSWPKPAPCNPAEQVYAPTKLYFPICCRLHEVNNILTKKGKFACLLGCS